MTRRRLLVLPGAALLPGAGYRDYSRCLPDYLGELAGHAYRLRNSEIATLTTPGAIRRRQAWVRETLWRLIGGMPARTPLNARATGSFERSGYRVEKVVYESRPDCHIPANLYIPSSGQPPYPGVLFQIGHSNKGKADSDYQRCCQGLAKSGCVVLAFDPMGQGERVYYPDASGTRTRLPSADAEHTLPGKQMLLLGDTATRFQLWDAIRSLDYLTAHPLVDPRRLGATGHSGGGTLTMFLVAVDNRLAAAAVMQGNTENMACADFNPPGSTDDAEQNLIDSGPAGFDRWDLLYPFAPKPLLISVSRKDFFATYSSRYISSGWEEFGKLRKIYETLGAAERVAWADTPLPHGLSCDSRLQVYNWFTRHLKGESGEIKEEPAVAPEPDEILRATPGGNVVVSFRDETPFQRNRARLGSFRTVAPEQLLRVDRPAPGVRAAVLRRVPSHAVAIEALEVPSAPKVWLPAWLYLPREGKASGVLIALEPAGRNVRWREGELYQEIASRGCAVCVPDLRGVGDLLPEIGRGAAPYARSHATMENYAWASMVFGTPLLGQRVTDLLAITAALCRHEALADERVVLAASGKMTVPALFAAALEPRIEQVYLSGGLVSYRSIVETEAYSTPFENFAPGLLLHTDLPEVAASLAPRRLTLAGAVNASGETLDAAEVRNVYRSNNVLIRPKAQWDLEALCTHVF